MAKIRYRVYLRIVFSSFQSLHFCLNTLKHHAYGQISNIYLKKPKIAVVISIYAHISADILSFTLTKLKRIYERQFRKSIYPNFLRWTPLMSHRWILNLSGSGEPFGIHVTPDEEIGRAQVWCYFSTRNISQEIAIGLLHRMAGMLSSHGYI